MTNNKVTKKTLNTLVIKFYTKVVKDDLIGPIFIDVLGKDLKDETWQEHIQLLTNFWASISIGDDAYKSSPFAPHVKFEERLSVQAFERWLKLFLETLNTMFDEHTAGLFHARAKLIAGNFMRNLNII